MRPGVLEFENARQAGQVTDRQKDGGKNMISFTPFCLHVFAFQALGGS
jgi:hypothetical protein